MTEREMFEASFKRPLHWRGRDLDGNGHQTGRDSCCISHLSMRGRLGGDEPSNSPRL